MRNPSPEELLAALSRIRCLPRCAGWPADVRAVLADPVRARLLRIEAIRWRRAPAQRARQASRLRATGSRRAPLALPLPLFDCKRAAAGERAED